MAKAVLVLLVPVAVLVALYVFFFGGNNVITVDPSSTYADARAANTFTVLQPTDLPTSWKPVSSAFQPGKPATLRVGYVTPSGAGVQLVESSDPASTLVQDELGKGAAVGNTITANGRVWGVVNATNGSNRGLVESESGRTVIIKGQASQAELSTLAASLN